MLFPSQARRLPSTVKGPMQAHLKAQIGEVKQTIKRLAQAKD